MLPNLNFPADLVTFTEEILNGKFQLLRSDAYEATASNNKVLSVGAHFVRDNCCIDLKLLEFFGLGRITGIEIGRFLNKFF